MNVISDEQMAAIAERVSAELAPKIEEVRALSQGTLWALELLVQVLLVKQGAAWGRQFARRLRLAKADDMASGRPLASNYTDALDRIAEIVECGIGQIQSGEVPEETLDILRHFWGTGPAVLQYDRNPQTKAGGSVIREHP